MSVPGFFTKASVLTWSVILGLAFILGFTAISALGTKSNGKFQVYQGPAAGQAVPPTSSLPDAAPAGSSPSAPGDR
jgi:hypothetical protein